MLSVQPERTIGDRLKAAKQNGFLGRQTELRLFDALLTQAGTGEILNVHGPGGIGKSTLLDGFRRCAESRGVTYLYIDAPDFGTAPAHFFRRLCGLLDVDPASGADTLLDRINGITQRGALVIAIDTFEECGDLNRWLREQFLPRLPAHCRVVIAGRQPLTTLWQGHPAWQALIRPMPLTNFDHPLTAQYLRLHGIREADQIERIWRYTGGHPLALSLTAHLATQPEGTADLPLHDDTSLVTTLTQRWLRELPDSALRPFVEAAAMVRHFNQDLLQQISGARMDPSEFQRLTACSFVRNSLNGWSLHSLVRKALASELSQRSPSHYLLLRLRALNSLAQVATGPSLRLDRNAALQEFFYLLGDSLVRAALYNEEVEPAHGLYIEPADASDIPALQAYMQAWRIERGVLADTPVELFDPGSDQHIAQHVVAEPREPDFLDMRALVETYPGAVRLLKHETNAILGMTIVLPINAGSLEDLAKQPVMGHYFSALSSDQQQQFMTPPAQTGDWFVRLIDTRDPGDNMARATLFRDLAALLIRPARFITSTPLALYQSLLTRFGFKQLELPPHFDFGVDRPAPFFELDLRGKRLGQHLSALIQQHLGSDADLPVDSLLASMAQASTVAPASPAPMTREQTALPLEVLTAREREVALAAVEGLPNCVIAARLDITEVTVKKHMGRIFKKMGLRNRAQLISRYWSQAPRD